MRRQGSFFPKSINPLALPRYCHRQSCKHLPCAGGWACCMFILSSVYTSSGASHVLHPVHFSRSCSRSLYLSLLLCKHWLTVFHLHVRCFQKMAHTNFQMKQFLRMFSSVIAAGFARWYVWLEEFCSSTNTYAHLQTAGVDRAWFVCLYPCVLSTSMLVDSRHADCQICTK